MEKRVLYYVKQGVMQRLQKSTKVQSMRSDYCKTGMNKMKKNEK